MLTSWLTFLAVLAGSAGPGRAAIGRSVVTVRPTCRVKGHSGASQTLRCGDGKNPGVVEYWHTPFGDFQSSRFHSDLDPVFMHPDSSLVIPNSSGLHSGLYYCLLRQTQGTTLWPYELNVHDHGGRQDGSSGDPMRFRRDVGSKEEELVADPDRQFAAAVASSVLLTFVLGFTAGALSRTHVLRCLGAVAKRLRLTRQKRRQIETGDPGDEVTMVTVPSMYDNHAFQVEEELYETQETTSSHPDEPQKNVQHQQEEQRETTTYLEGCDNRQEEEKRLEEEEEEEEEKGQFGGFYLIGEDGGSETEEEKCSEDKEEEESREEKKERRREEEEDRNEEAERGSQEKWRGEKVEEEGQRKEKRREGDEETDISSDSDGEPDRKQDGGQEPPSSSSSSSSLSSPSSPASPASPSSPASPPRRSRIIRLYQYDEDGQRYCHLSDPAPSDTGPTPRLKQRSLSLTRLNTIMAAASAGPLDTSQRERETKEREGRPHFHLEI